MSEDILNDFVPYIHIDLFREGIVKRTIKKFGLGYSYRWRRTIFPIRYWLDGTLMGYNARSSIENCSEFGISKYFITPGTVSYTHLDVYKRQAHNRSVLGSSPRVSISPARRQE